MDNIVIIGEYVKEYSRLLDIRFSPFWFSILHHPENGDHINLGDMDGSYIKYFTGVFHGGRKSATFSWECGSTGAERGREMDAHKCAEQCTTKVWHIYTWWQCSVKYWQIIWKLLHCLPPCDTFTLPILILTSQHKSPKKLRPRQKCTKQCCTPSWWNMTHRNFLPTSLVGKGAVGGQRASERGPYISCIWPTCIGLT